MTLFESYAHSPPQNPNIHAGFAFLTGARHFTAATNMHSVPQRNSQYTRAKTSSRYAAVTRRAPAYPPNNKAACIDCRAHSELEN